MDLIYADKNKIELGVIQDCIFDCAFGVEENDFECIVDMENHVCLEDYYIYFDQTQYGGIIDRIAVSTEDHTVSYSGRTWHGILNSRVLCPEAGADYLTLIGDANEVLEEILALTGLMDVFKVSTEESGIYIPGYQVRYEYAYTAILKMLSAVNGKLIMTHTGGMVELSAVTIADYSNNEEFDSSQVGFRAEKAYNVENHFICLGSGELRNRHVIHLFTDENGAIQPYSMVAAPLKDADYILDESGKLMTGIEERVHVYDYNNAQTTENYVVLMEEPDGWKNHYPEYYRFDSEGEKYKQLERAYGDIYTVTKDQPADWLMGYKNYWYLSDGTYRNLSELVKGTAYEVLKSQPGDWKEKFGDYFYLEDGEYKPVQLVESVSYKKLIKQPNDWKKNYGDYFYHYTDGVNTEYKSIEGNTKNYYTMQVKKPTDWQNGYGNYYTLNEKGKYVNVVISGYKRVLKQPDDWSRKYGDYVYYFSDGVNTEYRSIQGKQRDTYTVQTAKPTDWAENYDGYYEKNADGRYVVVTIGNYIALTAKPADWARKYDTYYYRFSDGTASEYRKISGITTDKYVLQINRPTDWYENYSSYYRYSKETKTYETVKGIEVSEISDEKVAPTWKQDTYYTKESVAKAPDYTSFSKVYRKGNPPVWKADTYYTKGSRTVAPSFTSFKRVYRMGNPPGWKKKRYYTKEQKKVTPKFSSFPRVYRKVVSSNVPAWKSGTYYDDYTVNDLTWEKGKYFTRKENQELIPVFVPGEYFRQYLDHYADLVTNAIAKIQEIYNCDSIDISLDAEEAYDIGDIVGASEAETGISVWQPITKKIVKIKDGMETIEYEVGGKK